MKCCLEQRISFFAWVQEGLWQLYSRVTTALSENRSAAKETQAAQAAGREAVNRQAERILDEYGNSILRLAYSYLHNMSDAEEVLQDTLLQFLRTAPAFANGTHEKAWLLRVAGNLSKNRIDYNRVRATDELFPFKQKPPLSGELAAEGREDLSFVWDAVKSLPVKYREVIHLFYYEDYSTSQIAQMLDRKETTVRSDLRRGRIRLKEILKKGYNFEESL